MSVRALRERLGDNGMVALEEVIHDAGKRWKADVLALAAERFEGRLGEEIGGLRVDMVKEFASVRTEMAKEFAAVRTEMANEFAVVRTEMGNLRFALLQWCFVFWIGQVAAMTAMMAFLLKTIR